MLHVRKICASWRQPLAAAIMLAATSPAFPAPPGPTVKIDNFAFAPASLTVKTGATVTWTNDDDLPHTIVSRDQTSFRSSALDTDQSFAFTFVKPGEYAYFCSLHPHMMGKIVVQN